MKKKLSRLLSILIISLVVMPAPSFAEEAESLDDRETVLLAEETLEEEGEESYEAPEVTEVTIVDSVEELSRESDTADNEPFFSIDVSEKELSEELASDEVNKSVEEILEGGGGVYEKKDAVIETLEGSGLYIAEEGKGKTVDVISQFAYQRLSLIAEQSDFIEAFGAVNAVYYDDRYLLSYGSEEATRSAYEALTEYYGEDAVLIDLPLKISSSAVGWGTDFMGMDSEQSKAAEGSDVTVAVIDSGITASHVIFSNHTILSGWDFVNGDSDPADDNGHGTGVAGIIAESTPSNVKIMPIKTVDANGEGSTLDTLNAVKYANNYGADIINMSLGGYLKSESLLEQYDKQFSEYESLIVCAAGNEEKYMDESGVYEFPGELSCTVCVSAISKYGRFCSAFSNYGSAVDFCAPGSSLKLAYKNGGYLSSESGTSFSSPYIAAAAALVKAEDSSLSNQDIVSTLESISVDLGDEGKDIYYGAGYPKFEESTRIAACSVSGISKKTYTGSQIMQDITVSCDGDVLNEGEDYTITYSNNKNVGTASVKISGSGKYYGTITETFKILPKGTKLSKIYRSRKALTVKWNKQKTKMSSSRITGYQIQLATNKAFTKNKKTVTVKGYGTVSKKIKKLKAKKKYYIRIRTYKTVGGVKYYSEWSSVKTKKTR